MPESQRKPAKAIEDKERPMPLPPKGGLVLATRPSQLTRLASNLGPPHRKRPLDPPPVPLLVPDRDGQLPFRQRLDGRL